MTLSFERLKMIVSFIWHEGYNEPGIIKIF